MRAAPLLLLAALAAAPLTLLAQAPPNVTIQLQFARLLMNEARYRDAIDAYRRAVAITTADPALASQAHAGLSLALLRTGDFSGARKEAEHARAGTPSSAALESLYADTLWASGLFDEAEQAYEDAMRRDPAD